jgi:hypothetical protein
VAGSGQNHDVARRRQFARVSLLKRRSAIASVLGFAALFGLAAQHTVKGASAQSAVRSSSTRTPATSTTFFDQRGDGFAFDDQGPGFVGSADPPAPPVTQTSVS